MVQEMERHREPLVIIAHQGILRLIYAFYMGLPREQAPYVSIPLNTVIKLVPGTYTCEEERRVLLKLSESVCNDGQNEPQPRSPSDSALNTDGGAGASSDAPAHSVAPSPSEVPRRRESCDDDPPSH